VGSLDCPLLIVPAVFSSIYFEFGKVISLDILKYCCVIVIDAEFSVDNLEYMVNMS
jgi:hypothetical protein